GTQLAFGSVFQPADRQQYDLHSVRVPARSGCPLDAGLLRLARPVHAPDFLQIVEAAYFRPEDMDEQIAAIDQHPVGMRQALDADRALSRLLESPDDPFRNGRDMTVRAPRGDHHTVRD